MQRLCRERSCPYPGRSACLSVLTDVVEQSLRRCALTGRKSAEDENPECADSPSPGKGPKAV